MEEDVLRQKEVVSVTFDTTSFHFIFRRAWCSIISRIVLRQRGSVSVRHVPHG